MRKKTIGIITSIVAVVIVVCLAVAYLWPKPDFAPDFRIKDIDGKDIVLSSYRGKSVVALDFMYIDCPGCEILRKNLDQIYPEYKDRVTVISVDVLTQDTIDELRLYRNQSQVKWQVASDTDNLKEKFGVMALPTLIIVDKNGYPVHSGQGEPSPDELKGLFNKAIEGSASAITIMQMSVFALAIFAGAASFFSPCSFPMFPGYMTLYLGFEQEQMANDQSKKETDYKRRAFYAGSAASLGIIFIFLILGGLIIFIGRSFASQIPLLQPIIGAILIVLGALMFTNISYWRLVRPFQRLGGMVRRKKGVDQPQPSDDAERAKKGFYVKLFAYGMGYGAASAGCVAPLFIAVISEAMLGSLLDGVFALALYTLTAALLMIIVTVLLATASRKSVDKLKQYTPLIKKISAAVLILVGIYLLAYFYLAWG
jgi:cytochrome c-type biogenesis protein